jgi:hypothetical protein
MLFDRIAECAEHRGGVHGVFSRMELLKNTTPSLRAKRSNPEAAKQDWIASSLRSSQ